MSSLFNILCSAVKAFILRSSFFWDVTQRRLVTEVSGQPIGPNCKVQAAWTLQLGPIGCPGTSVTNCQSSLRSITEEQRSHLHRGGSLKSGTTLILSDNSRLSLPTATPPRMWAVRRLSYGHAINEPTGSVNRSLLDKIMAFYCLWYCVIRRHKVHMGTYVGISECDHLCMDNYPFTDQWLLYVPPVWRSDSLHSVRAVYLCVLYGSQKKQRLFPYKALKDWFV
jgi:hypothetical protein